MTSVEKEVTLNAPPDRVWSFLVALRFLPVWLDQITSVEAISTPTTQAGTTFTLTRRGRHQPESWIVMGCEPNRSLHLVEYRRDEHLICRLEPAPNGTRLLIEYSVRTGRGLLGRLIPASGLRTMMERTGERLTETFMLNQDIRLLHGMGDE